MITLPDSPTRFIQAMDCRVKPGDDERMGYDTTTKLPALLLSSFGQGAW
jgi:hypothetical protein